MKGYFRASFIAASLLAAAGGLFLGGCTDVDDTIGLDLVPDDQKMVIQTKTIDGIKSYSAFSDSLPTSHLRRMAFGSMKTDFGTTTVRSVYQFMPLESVKHRGEHYFGEGAVLDSAYIVLYINNISGDTRIPQNFNIYPLKDTMTFEQVYYPNYDVSYNVEAEPVFRFKFEKEITGSRPKKIWPIVADGETADPETVALNERAEAYLQKIVDLPKEVWEDEDKGEGLFHQAVPGFYIENYVAPGDPEGNAIYEGIMADSYTMTDLSYLSIYTHTGEGEDAEVLETKFYFDDKAASYYKLSNLSILLINHDYSTATNGIDPADFLKYQVAEEPGEGGKMPSLEGVPVEETVYVQDMAGAAAYINFDADFKQKLTDLLTYDETEYSSLYINRAKLILPLADDGAGNYPSELKYALKRLGLYFEYKGDLPVSMPDYPYMDEIMNSTESSFGGYLNYSRSYYEMDVSTYIRQIITNPDKTRSQLWISPAFNASGFSQLGEVMLSNTPDRPMRLEITYTLIK